MQGTVDRVVPDEGFGFIIGPNGEEYFFHRTGLKGAEWEEIGPGSQVNFQIGEDPGDRRDEHLRAVDVFLPTASPQLTTNRCPRARWAASEAPA